MPKPVAAATAGARRAKRAGALQRLRRLHRLHVLRLPAQWLAWAAWLATAVMAIAATCWAIDRLSLAHLHDDAERGAIGWARQIAQQVPAIDRVFAGDLPTPQAQARLAGMLGTAGLLRFQLFDNTGMLLLSSDALALHAAPSSFNLRDSALALRSAQQGRPQVQLSQGDRQTDAQTDAPKDGRRGGERDSQSGGQSGGQSGSQQLPAVYSQAFVPVLQHGQANGQMLGVLAVFTDQTELAATTARSFQRAAFTAGLALTIALASITLLWRWRAGRDRSTQDRVHYLAHHDVLTGAINHASFSDRLGRACADMQRDPSDVDHDADNGADSRLDNGTDPSGSRRATARNAPGARPTHAAGDADSLDSTYAPQAGLAVLCIDLDRFGDINDAHGHHAGDQLLRQAAARLRGVLRGADLLARLAGDRFAVLQREAGSHAAVQGLAQRILDSLAQPYTVSGTTQTVVVTASVGAAVYGVDGHDADNLLHRAQLALLQAKAQGHGRWNFYDAVLDHALHERRALAGELRQALADQALLLHFQPVYGAVGEGLIGYEALARWPHPTRGLVPPMTFISVAEETGQIELLGRWVLDSACREAATWPDRLSVAVNLSPAQFRRGGTAIVDEVRQALRASGLAPQRLELEITESLLMNHTDQVLATLHALHAMGVRIAMDDFGTGYSSLAYLWRFPFDKLKIDRAFTQGLGSDGRVDVIVNSIVTLAHSLAIRVNAEGVETDAQRQALRQHGCDELQGFLLGRPQPPAQLAHRVQHAVASMDTAA